MRVRLRRDPDVFDSRLMGLLRYGNEPAQTLHMSRRDGQRGDRSSATGFGSSGSARTRGEDLTFATICDGVLECPRHHWKWDVATGECIEGGNLKLRVEQLACRAAGTMSGH